MDWSLFGSGNKNCLGVDIGTAAIRIVELSQRNDRIKLENYGEASALTLYEKPFRTIDKNTLLLSSQEISKAIKAILQEAKIAERKAIFSIPDFASFYIDFTLPPMTKEEVPEAVKYEARQYIPMPLSEVILDWSIIEGELGKKKKAIPLKVLLIAVPTEFVNQYQEIASLSGLNLISAEAKAFGLIRSLLKGVKGTNCVLDIGAQSTNINIVQNGILKKSYSLDISGNDLTQQIAKSLGIDYNDAEILKKEKGMNESEPSVRKILLTLVNHMIAETEKTLRDFYQSGGEEVEKVFLSGGSAKIPGLKKYFSESLKKEVEIANPFKNIFYPPLLEEKLTQMGPSYATAVGSALRGLEIS
jgi:type IV pilus assembly protein PilM